MSNMRPHLVAAFVIVAFAFCNATRVTAQHMNAASSPCRNPKPDQLEVQCFMEAARVANNKLNDYYKMVRQHLEIEDRKRLEIAQRLYIRFRDQNCDAEYKLYEGGSAGPTVRYACLEADTRQRLVELKTMYQWLLDR